MSESATSSHKRQRNSNYNVSLPIHSKHLFHFSFFYFILGSNHTKKIWAFSFFSFLSSLFSTWQRNRNHFSHLFFFCLFISLEHNRIKLFLQQQQKTHCTEEANALSNDLALSPFIDLKSIECDTFYTDFSLFSHSIWRNTISKRRKSFSFLFPFYFKSKAILFSSSQKNLPIHPSTRPHEKKNQNKWSYSFPAIYLRWDRLKLFLCWFFHVFN